MALETENLSAKAAIPPFFFQEVAAEEDSDENGRQIRQQQKEQSSQLILADAAIPKNDPSTKKWTMLVLLWMVAVLSALDRVAMSVAIIPMSQEYGFTDSVKGSISSLFSVGYGLAILPAGLLVANASPRIVMAAGLAFWSLATMATPLVTGLPNTMVPLLLVRASVGAAESVVLPTMQRLLSAWTTADEKSVALAILFSGFQTGTVLAYLLSPTIIDIAGGGGGDDSNWRGLFYCYGAMGLVALVPWLILAKDRPSPLPSVDTIAVETGGMLPVATAAQVLEPATAAPSSWSSSWQDSIQVFHDAPWKQFSQSKGCWAMLLTHSAKNWGLYNSLAWTPTFYAEQYDIGVRDSAWLSVLPSLAAVVGGLIAGSAADAIIRRLSAHNDNGKMSDESLSTVRKVFQSIGMYGPAVTLAALALHIPEDPVVAQTFLTITVGLQAFNAAGFEAGVQEKAGERWAGLLYSVTSLPAVMVGTLGVFITGQVLDFTHQDWTYVFGINALVNVLGATTFLVMYDSKREFD
jgi:MFS transporter, ACS family, solute carrier family 17 (sodium-dependent inorganic phosphate cotransporter), other